MSRGLTLGGSRFAALFLVLLAGCAEAPDAAPTPTSTPTASTPAAVDGVALALHAPKEARAGEPVDIELVLRNNGTASVWTNPAFACGGSWDVEVRDPAGERLRVDDRDAMGCPDTLSWTTEVPAGMAANATYHWDGQLHPSLGERQPPPPGTYTLVGVVGYAADGAPDNGARGERATARVTILIKD